MENNYTLRISITSACNLNCIYCNTQRKIDVKSVMSKDDIMGIINAGFKAGVRKISWTGGEPTVRPDFIDIVREAKEVGIKKQSMTTNGILYYKMAEQLKDAGISKINFSLDTLDPEEYKKICGYDGFDKAIKSINMATKLYERIKINCVVTKANRHVTEEMINYFDKYGDKIIIRFLEMVPCGQMYKSNKSIFGENFLSVNEMIDDFKKIGKITPVDVEGDVPKSLYYKIAGKMGIYGVNPNYSVGYVCDKTKCPKIRISPNGFVSNCSIQLKYVRDFRVTTQEEKNKLMSEIVNEKKIEAIRVLSISKNIMIFGGSV
ncbi:MAG: radical SAM protein [Candidatus Berkelbacteria bacterium]